MQVLRECFCCCCVDKPERRVRSKLVDWRQHPYLAAYELQHVIGEGGFSEVWLALHKLTKQKVVIKAVYLSKPGLRPEQAVILEAEAKFLRLLDHPHIVRCHSVLESKYDLVLVLEYLEGGELLEHLQTMHHFNEGQAAALFRQVVEAVAYMHGLNLLHRDIKPENVMFKRPVAAYQAAGKAPKVKLIDLGMAGVLGTKASGMLHGCMGSPGFMAPEVVRGGRHSEKMDVYSLGVLLFVMLTGRKPFNLRDVQSLQYAHRSIREAPGLQDPVFLRTSLAAQDLIVRMLADAPEQRPTAKQVLAHPWISGANGPAPQRPVIDALVRRRMAQLASLRQHRGLAFALCHNAEAARLLGAAALGLPVSKAQQRTAGATGRGPLTGPRAADLQVQVEAVAGVETCSNGLSQAQCQPAEVHGSCQVSQDKQQHQQQVVRAGQLAPEMESLLQGIKLQRKLVHQEMRSRARARAASTQPPAAGASCPTPQRAPPTLVTATIKSIGFSNSPFSPHPATTAPPTAPALTTAASLSQEHQPLLDAAAAADSCALSLGPSAGPTSGPHSGRAVPEGRVHGAHLLLRASGLWPPAWSSRSQGKQLSRGTLDTPWTQQGQQQQALKLPVLREGGDDDEGGEEQLPLLAFACSAQPAPATDGQPDQQSLLPTQLPDYQHSARTWFGRGSEPAQTWNRGQTGEKGGVTQALGPPSHHPPAPSPGPSAYDSLPSPCVVISPCPSTQPATRCLPWDGKSLRPRQPQQPTGPDDAMFGGAVAAVAAPSPASLFSPSLSLLTGQDLHPLLPRSPHLTPLPSAQLLLQCSNPGTAPACAQLAAAGSKAFGATSSGRGLGQTLLLRSPTAGPADDCLKVPSTVAGRLSTLPAIALGLALDTTRFSTSPAHGAARAARRQGGARGVSGKLQGREPRRRSGEISRGASGWLVGGDVHPAATALLAAPYLRRSWSAPEPGTLPDMLANAVGAPGLRLAAAQDLNPGSSPYLLAYRCASLSPLALAFLLEQDAMVQMLGLDQDQLLQPGSLARPASSGQGIGLHWLSAYTSPNSTQHNGYRALQLLGSQGSISQSPWVNRRSRAGLVREPATSAAAPRLVVSAGRAASSTSLLHRDMSLNARLSREQTSTETTGLSADPVAATGRTLPARALLFDMQSRRSSGVPEDNGAVGLTPPALHLLQDSSLNASSLQSAGLALLGLAVQLEPSPVTSPWQGAVSPSPACQPALPVQAAQATLDLGSRPVPEVTNSTPPVPPSPELATELVHVGATKLGRPTHEAGQWGLARQAKGNSSSNSLPCGAYPAYQSPAAVLMAAPDTQAGLMGVEMSGGRQGVMAEQLQGPQLTGAPRQDAAPPHHSLAHQTMLTPFSHHLSQLQCVQQCMQQQK